MTAAFQCAKRGPVVTVPTAFALPVPEAECRCRPALHLLFSLLALASSSLTVVAWALESLELLGSAQGVDAKLNERPPCPM